MLEPTANRAVRSGSTSAPQSLFTIHEIEPELVADADNQVRHAARTPIDLFGIAVRLHVRLVARLGRRGLCLGGEQHHGNNGD
jgi:hypothetical protein